MGTRLILDCHGLCHRVKAASQKYTLSHEEKRTEIIFNFLQEILKYATLYETNQFIFAWDSRQRLRYAIYPDYKKKDKVEKTQEELEEDEISFLQFSEIRRDVLPMLGFQFNYVQTGIEADDLIASVVENNKETNFIIISSDNDLYQLLSENVSIHSPFTKQLFNQSDFINKFGIHPDRWYEVKALAGCNSDKVPGIPSVGEIRAIQYIKGELPITSKAYKNITSIEGCLIYSRNKTLVKLPFPETSKIIINGYDTLYKKNFAEVFTSYGFRSFLTMEGWNSWTKNLNLQ